MKQIVIADIVIDGGTQVRQAINESVVADYAERMSEGVKFPNVVLFHDGNRYYCADGFHRIMASQRVGFKDIAADVRAGTMTDALWFALGANKENGQRLSASDKKHAILLALKTWPDRSQQQIADQIGCTREWIGQVKRNTVEVTSTLPTRVTGKDGKSYPASRPETQIAKSERRAEVGRLADKGYTSPQIAKHIGITEESFAHYKSRNKVDVPADRIVTRSPRIDSNRVLDSIVETIEHAADDQKLVNVENLNMDRLPAWIRSLKASRSAINRLVQKLETAQLKGTHVA